ncbi:cytochrome c oxidase assembly protein COX16 homolog, mitochondrial isoform X3 [Leptonychotes weddellii]|uniref:Cytochrome c oxidase assembly protein COX16 homolog, mitochondrial n=1 Tax=Leptonychotes weddellii TaxID=9713 RepID=A0A7F8QXW5_LEPWE|nr:cytochrome c oxidase assembly protein COX16 homolog, mitochondrial isoform X3 [Leptonychotes weddellii]
MCVHAVMRALRKNKTLRYGVPMLLLIVGGSFGLREFSQIRYDAVKIKIDPELEKKLKMSKVSLESEYELSSTCHWQKQSPRAALSTWLMLPTDI